MPNIYICNRSWYGVIWTVNSKRNHHHRHIILWKKHTDTRVTYRTIRWLKIKKFIKTLSFCIRTNSHIYNWNNDYIFRNMRILFFYKSHKIVFDRRERRSRYIGNKSRDRKGINARQQQLSMKHTKITLVYTTPTICPQNGLQNHDWLFGDPTGSRTSMWQPEINFQVSKCVLRDFTTLFISCTYKSIADKANQQHSLFSSHLVQEYATEK